MSANLFGQMLTFTGAPQAMVASVETLHVSPSLVDIILMLISFVICMFLCPTEFMLISVPVFSPLIQAMGFDAIGFGCST